MRTVRAWMLDPRWPVGKLKKASNDDAEVAEHKYELTNYQCQMTPINSVRPLRINPLWSYSIAYEFSTAGQRAFLELVRLHRYEAGMMNAIGKAVIIGFSDPQKGLLFDHGTTTITKVEAAETLCSDCIIAIYRPYIELSFNEAATITIPLPVAFVLSFYLTFFFYLLMFVFILFAVLLRRIIRVLPLVEQFTILADYPFTLVFSFGVIVAGLGMLAFELFYGKFVF